MYYKHSSAIFTGTKGKRRTGDVATTYCFDILIDYKKSEKHLLPNNGKRLAMRLEKKVKLIVLHCNKI